MSIYQSYATNQDLERDGSIVQYDDLRIQLARAGGANKRYERAVTRLTKNYRRAIQTETLPLDKALEIRRDALIEACIVRCWTRTGEEDPNNKMVGWEEGLPSPNERGAVVPATPENLRSLFVAMPDLFTDVEADSNSRRIYQDETRENDAKNS